MATSEATTAASDRHIMPVVSKLTELDPHKLFPAKNRIKQDTTHHETAQMHAMAHHYNSLHQVSAQIEQEHHLAN